MLLWHCIKRFCAAAAAYLTTWKVGVGGRPIPVLLPHFQQKIMMMSGKMSPTINQLNPKCALLSRWILHLFWLRWRLPHEIIFWTRSLYQKSSTLCHLEFKGTCCVPALESVDSNSATFGLQPPFLISSFLHIMSSQTHVHSHSSWMTNDPLWATTAKQQQRRLAWFQFLGDNKEDTKNFRTKKWVSEKLSLTRAVGDLRVQHDKFPLPKGWFGNGSRMRCDTTQKLSPFV